MGYKYTDWWLLEKSVDVEDADRHTRPSAMRLIILAVLLGMVALVLGRRDPDRSGVADSRSAEAFISRQESANFARRPRRSNIHNLILGAPQRTYGARVRSPLEAKREVCELNPDCDELADHIGFKEAYRRFYGPV